MLEKMRESGSSRFLARRANVGSKINGDDRVGTVDVENHFQPIWERELLVLDFEKGLTCRFLSRNGKHRKQKTSDGNEMKFRGFHTYVKFCEEKAAPFQIQEIDS